MSATMSQSGQTALLVVCYVNETVADPYQARILGAMLWESTMMETLNARFRHVVVFLIIAVFVAAVLRHGLHTYGSISREEIRTAALMALPFAVLIYLTLSAIKRRR